MLPFVIGFEAAPIVATLLYTVPTPIAPLIDGGGIISGAFDTATWVIAALGTMLALAVGWPIARRLMGTARKLAK